MTEITQEMYRSLGLSDALYRRILKILGRRPSLTELAMFSVEWSEHCGYLCSRKWLKLLPKKGRFKTLIGEDSGGIIVDDFAIIFKMESHNHPSQVEPRQGAATGIGGIIRDIFTAGARPVALLDSLRFGELNKLYNRYLLKGVVDGIQFYGNCLDGAERIIIRNSGHIRDVEIGRFSKQFISPKQNNIEAIPSKRIEVLSIDSKTLNPCWQQIRRIFKRKTNKILVINTTMGRKLKITPDHPVVVYENKQLKIKEASRLQIGEELPLLNTLPLDSEEVIQELDLIELLGNQNGNIRVKFKRGFEEKKDIFRKELLNIVPSVRRRHWYLKKAVMPIKVYKTLEKRLHLSRQDIQLYKPSGKANYIPPVIKLDKDFCRLLGYYLSEGCVSKNGSTYKIIWVFNQKENEYIEDVCNILNKIGVRFSVYSRKNTKAIYLSSWFLGILFKKILKCGSSANQKEIPEIIFRQPKYNRIELLKGLFRGDASVVFYKSGSRVRISFASVCSKLIHQATLLLQDLGIFPAIYRYNRRKSHKIEGRNIAGKAIEALEILNYESIIQMQDWFASDINRRIKESLNRYQGTTFSFPRFANHGTFSTVRIKDIKKIKRQQNVYDLEVDNTHLFVTSSGIITHNCVGVPTVGGEIYFEDAYTGNCLVNVMCVGVCDKNKLMRARAKGKGNAIIYAGASTGRDGIGGCSVLASAEFGRDEEKRPTVQIGDPFMEKCLIEATLEAIATGYVVGIKDMGAAGLTCSTSEMASSGGVGVTVDLKRVPRREENMQPWEIMMSESQERMLLCVKKGREGVINGIFSRWGLNSVVIGRVTDDNTVRIKDSGKTVACIPADALTSPPMYDMPYKRPGYIKEIRKLNIKTLRQPADYNKTLLKILASPTIANKSWVYEQYDHMVQTNTVVLPGAGDGAVLRLKGSNRAIAVTTDCSGRYCYLDPFRGSQIAVAEAARNLVCAGAQPAAITDCLNFGNPQKPDRFWQFKNCVQGITDACRSLRISVVSGNVSFYNENPRGAIYPTPTIGMLGVIDDLSRITAQAFKRESELIILLGRCLEELGGSEYLKVIHKRVCGRPPALNLDLEARLQNAALGMIKQGLVSSAHDCSEGGLAVALAECCISRKEAMLGADICNLPSKIRPDALLFGETQSRLIISAPEKSLNRINQIAKRYGIPLRVIGRTTKKANLRILSCIDLSLEKLRDAWNNSLEAFLIPK